MLVNSSTNPPLSKRMNEKKFTKTQWKKMRVVTKADATRGVIKADSDGYMWLWKSANGHHVWGESFKQFPYRNDLHRLMSIL